MNTKDKDGKDWVVRILINHKRFAIESEDRYLFSHEEVVSLSNHIDKREQPKLTLEERIERVEKELAI